MIFASNNLMSRSAQLLALSAVYTVRIGINVNYPKTSSGWPHVRFPVFVYFITPLLITKPKPTVLVSGRASSV